MHGRPVSFAFAGKPSRPDGSTVTVDAALLRKSLNYKSLLAGEAYPLFYETLFPDLRATLTTAAVNARKRRRVLWPADQSQRGLRISNVERLEVDGVIFPKLFRRLIEFFSEGHQSVRDFPDWLQAKKEQVLDLTTGGFTHFDNVVDLTRTTIKLKRRPEELVYYRAKTTKPRVSPRV